MDKSKNKEILLAILTLEALSPEQQMLLIDAANASIILTSAALSKSMGIPLFPKSLLEVSDLRAKMEDNLILKARESTGQTRDCAFRYMRTHIPEWRLQAFGIK